MNSAPSASASKDARSKRISFWLGTAVNMFCHVAMCSSGFIWQSVVVMPGIKQSPEDICPSGPIVMSAWATPRKETSKNTDNATPMSAFIDFLPTDIMP